MRFIKPAGTFPRCERTSILVYSKIISSGSIDRGDNDAVPFKVDRSDVPSLLVAGVGLYEWPLFDSREAVDIDTGKC